MGALDYVLCNLFSCGSYDLAFLDKEMDKFEQDELLDDFGDRYVSSQGQLGLKDLLYELYYNAVASSAEELGLNFEELEEDFAIDSNSVCSSLTVFKERAYSRDDIIRILTKNCLKDVGEDDEENINVEPF